MTTLDIQKRITNLKWSDDGQFLNAWLLANDGKTPMAFMKLMNHGKNLELCDIEVREEYRGQKAGVDFILAIGEYFGQNVIHSDALYTESGLRSIAPLFAMQNRKKKVGIPLSPMKFVADWDAMRPLFKL